MVMFISGIRPDAALRTADEIQKKLSEKSIEHKYSDISDKLTVSMGIYNTEYAGQDIYSLIDKADIALYRAKENIEKGKEKNEWKNNEYQSRRNTCFDKTYDSKTNFHDQNRRMLCRRRRFY